MGNNTLNTRSSGDVITADFFNDFNTALQTTVYGRNSSGAVVSGQNMGDSSFPWGTIYSNALVVNGSALDTSQITSPANRIVSGSSRSSSNQPYFLKANGSAASVQITGNTTNLIVDINGSAVTCSTDITISSLTTAPSSNNTCAVNMGDAADQELTRYWGEPKNQFVAFQAKDAENPWHDSITVDAMGSSITGLVGSYQAFKINDGSSDEYFLAYVESTTKLSKIIRGAFLDNSGLPVNRVKFADNDTITLMKLTWIFLQNDGTTTDVTYNSPDWSTTQPGSPATGDYWYDLNVNQWKRYSGSAFVTINRTLLGVCIQDTSNCVATRSLDFYYKPSEQNTIDLSRKDNTNVIFDEPNSKVWVYSNTIDFSLSAPEFNITTDLLGTGTRDSNATESASTYYYLYVKDTGALAMSDIGPRYRGDLGGSYHPSNPFRCVGVIYNNSSSNLEGLALTEKSKLLPAKAVLSDLIAAGGGGQANTTAFSAVNLTGVQGSTWFFSDIFQNGTSGAGGTNTKFELMPGTYRLKATIALRIQGTKYGTLRFYNYTSSSIIGYRTSMLVSDSGSAYSPPTQFNNVVFTISEKSIIGIEHAASATGGDLGNDYNIDSTIFSGTQVTIDKIK